MTSRTSLALVLVSLAGVVQPAEPLPQSTSDWVRKRAPKPIAGELFAAPRKAKPPPQSVAPVAPAPPAIPPLPYIYGGSGRIGDMSLVFLEKQGRSIVARVGDMVDGDYKVEAIEHDRAVLRYMPLDVAQVLPFAPGVTLPPPPAQLARANAAPAAAATVPLLVKPPDEITLGRESTFAIDIPRGSAAAKATIELGYDAEVLSVSGAKILRPGRAIVEMSTQEQQRSKELRLKAIGEVSAQTELDIEVKAFDAHGKRVEVHVPQHILSLVEGN